MIRPTMQKLPQIVQMTCFTQGALKIKIYNQIYSRVIFINMLSR